MHAKTKFQSTLLTLSLVLSVACGGSGGGSGAPAGSPSSSTTPQNPRNIPNVPAPTPSNNQVVDVNNVADLQDAVRNVNSDTTIRIAAGIYQLTNTLHITGGVQNVELIGATGNASDVIIQGFGMSNANFGNVPHGVMVSQAQDVLLAHLTIRDVYYHPVTLQPNAGAQRVTMRNLHLINAGEQFIKSNSGTNTGVNDGVVEDCIMEYETTARSSYTNGVDVHMGQNWIIRGCVFRNIQAPTGGGLAGPAILMWNGSQGTLTENNIFLNCARGIAYGLSANKPDDHSGGVIRNNVFYRAANQAGDVGIGVTNGAGAVVVHNTVILSGTYANAIEVRFSTNIAIEVRNNLCDANIQERNGANTVQSHNRTDAHNGDFVNLSQGDFHLSNNSSAIDQGQFHSQASVDIDGQSRPMGGQPDLGADERR